MLSFINKPLKNITPNFETFWTQMIATSSLLGTLLKPLTLFWIMGQSLRKIYYKFFKQQLSASEALIVVVGNLRLGGSAKTPTVIALSHALKNSYNIAIISLPYRTHSPLEVPKKIDKSDCPSLVGDEPLLMATECDCPVLVGPSRQETLLWALTHFQDIEIFLLDDGLQNPAIRPDVSIALFDNRAQNLEYFPAGPWRESIEYLLNYDFALRVDHGDSSKQPFKTHYAIKKQMASSIVHHYHREVLLLSHYKEVVFITTLAYPEPIIDYLCQMTFSLKVVRLADHQAIARSLYEQEAQRGLVIVTQKEWIKMQPYLTQHDLLGVLELHLEFETSVFNRIIDTIKRKLYDKKTQRTRIRETHLPPLSGKADL